MTSRPLASLIAAASLGIAASFGASACSGGDGGDDDPVPDAPESSVDEPEEMPRIDGPAYVDPDAVVSGG